MYLIITIPNCLNCRRSIELLENNNYPYIEIDRSLVSSNILGMCDLYESEMPYIFQLNHNGYESLETKIYTPDFP